MAALSPPVSVRMTVLAGELADDAAALTRIADRTDDREDADRLLSLARRLQRHEAALTTMAWEVDKGGGS